MFRVLMVATLVLALSPAREGNAHAPFQKQWYEHYLANHKDKNFVKHVRKEVKCLVCHQGKKRSDCNPYGELFIGKLEKVDRKNKKKIINTIKEIGKKRLDEKDKKSLTYDELIAKGQLPGGKLEDVKRPAKKKVAKE